MTHEISRRTALSLGASTLAASTFAPAHSFAQRIAPPSNAPVSISYYNYNLASAGIGAEATKELIAEFTAAQPNVKVEGVPVSSGQILARVQADLVAGRTPDVAQLVFSDLDFVVRNLGVKPMTDIVPPEEWAAHTGGMVPAGLNLGALDGKVYGLAYVFSTPVLFYNATLFKQAGLDPDMPPATWAAVKEAALKLRAATAKNGVYPGVYSEFDWLLQGLFLSNGGRALSEDRRRVTFGESGAVGAIEMLRDLVKSGANAKLAESESGDAFMSGNLGMILTTSVYQRAFLNAAKDKFELRAAKMPSFGDKPARPTNSGSALFILSKDPVKQRAAWELVKYMTSKRGYTVITSKIGYLPLRLDIVDDPQYLGAWARENPMVRPNLEQLTRLNQWVAFPGANYRQIARIQIAAVNEAVFGDGDIAKIMREAQERAQALMPRA
jgi:multiple sugar transport system substrate-binding protein